MKIWFGRIWEEIRFSYWFLPAVMATLAVFLSFMMIWIDQNFRSGWVQSAGWIWSGGAEGARGLLSTVAGSMITVVSLTFSITIVAFSQASSQFGPRLLRNFMKDTGNQFVLGTFTATFIYCLLILRTVRSGEEVEFTPHISVTLAIILALFSLGVLIYFIHHVAISIQAPYLVANVANDLLETIDRLFPEPYQETRDKEVEQATDLEALRDAQRGSEPILAKHNGYLQGIDIDRLKEVALSQDVNLTLFHRPGYFVSEGAQLVSSSPSRGLTDQVKKQIENAFTVGHVRTYTQDVEFAIEQLVEVAVRALSPGINDPFTAINCIDWLGTALKKLTGRTLSLNSVIRDDDGKVRVVFVNPVTFEGAVDAAFTQIRQSARSSAAVRIHLLKTITEILGTVQSSRQQEALLQQVRMTADVNQEQGPE